MQTTPQATAAFPLATRENSRTDWLSALPDALAFAVGIAVSWFAGWSASDLIWSLWLSSFVVGYAMIVWTIGQPATALAALAWRTRNDAGCSPRTLMVFLTLIAVGASFMLGFFTLHFGGFHYVHSQLLLGFFPIEAPGMANPGWGDKSFYLEVFRRYWIFLPSAFLSHRAAFLRAPLTIDRDRWMKSFAGSGKKNRDFFMEPYRNVLRMHGLLFFFFLAHFTGLDSFAVYAVVYAVYFFPWRLLRSGGDLEPAALPKKDQLVA